MDVFTRSSRHYQWQKCSETNEKKIHRYFEKQNLLFINQDNFSRRKTSQDCINKK